MHHGGDNAISARRQRSQNGHVDAPHPAHLGGKTTSSARASTLRR
jgi:hypothetical protein